MYNSELEEIVDTSHDWIVQRTGIHKRHIAEEQSALELAMIASQGAIEKSKLIPELIIVATTTPDLTFPAMSVILQSKLGFSSARVPAFDIQAVCSGFIYGLHIASAFINNGTYKNALVVGVDKMSNVIDWSDRNTCVLFGDGAGAAVLTSSYEDNSYIIDSIIYSDGDYSTSLRTSYGLNKGGKYGVIEMDGKNVFKHAVAKMVEVSNEILNKNNVSVSEVDYFVPHQANQRIIQAVSDALGINKTKVVSTVADHANCSAGSVPLALSFLQESGKLKSGDVILLVAFGAGFAWGAVLLKW
ncbi:ketoacyl-ACP synthase III [Candidatus Sneabacter namystus]|uniref:Beta-ketoacyl-[acyl-carrier-protein] synthase III n=2 Tax=Candidatus Sneabacter namystus TaxID=2601646 RepID=A0A5C0UIC5_9RICK|nr:ketoacyl-ACP synthase III [Candidatus Sneabacter namystus]